MKSLLIVAIVCLAIGMVFINYLDEHSKIIIFLGGETVLALDCLSGIYGGPCLVWDNDKCRSVCKDEGRTGGHCSARTQCWCEGC